MWTGKSELARSSSGAAWSDCKAQNEVEKGVSRELQPRRVQHVTMKAETHPMPLQCLTSKIKLRKSSAVFLEDVWNTCLNFSDVLRSGKYIEHTAIVWLVGHTHMFHSSYPI